MAIVGASRTTMGAADQSSQVSMCQLAADALARGNAAGPGLAESCTQLRAMNVAGGKLLIDARPVDPDLRVALTNAGRAIIAGAPALKAKALTLAEKERAYAIGVAVASAQGGFSPEYAARIRESLAPADRAGFDIAVGGLSRGDHISLTVNANNGAAAHEEGLPTAVYVGGGLVLAVGLGALVYKFVL